MLDERFLRAVDKLRVPAAGTELMAPFLHSLVRTIRPRTVVEVGSGYSTLFLLHALHECAAEHAAERTALIAKTRQMHAAGENGAGAGASGDMRFHDWLVAPPANLDPAFYATDYRPRLYAFDDLSAEAGAASEVVATAAALGLGERLTFVADRAIGNSARIALAHRPLDLVFNDAAEYEDFFAEYWDLINPRGGLLIFHNTVGSWSSSRLMVKDLKLRQAAAPLELEVMSLVEPHKAYQGSFTMVRRISALRERSFEDRFDAILDDADRLL